MINLTPTFLSEYHNFSRGFPDGINTIINVPNLTKVGKKITVSYKDTAYLKNPVFPVELYEYRRGKNMKLSIDGETNHCLLKETLPKIFIKTMA